MRSDGTCGDYHRPMTLHGFVCVAALRIPVEESWPNWTVVCFLGTASHQLNFKLTHHLSSIFIYSNHTLSKNSFVTPFHINFLSKLIRLPVLASLTCSNPACG
jgi:hypothetical protein